MSNRLVRSRTDVIIGGVCAGLGKYLGLDPVLVRIFFVLLTLVGGSGVLVYFILWMVMPREDQVEPQGDLGDRLSGVRDEAVASVQHSGRGSLYIGVALVLMGVYAIVKMLDVRWLAWMQDKYLLPALLVIGGAALLWRALRGNRQ